MENYFKMTTAHEQMTENQKKNCQELINDLDGCETFGRRLRSLRIQAGLTQKQLADRIGATKSMISYYELQERMPSSVSVKRMAEVFHVSTDYLLGIEKGESIDVSDLNEEDIQLVRHLVSVLREKNK